MNSEQVEQPSLFEKSEYPCWRMKALNSFSLAGSSGLMSAEMGSEWLASSPILAAVFAIIEPHPVQLSSRGLPCRCERWGQVREEVPKGSKREGGRGREAILQSDCPLVISCSSRHPLYQGEPGSWNAFIEPMIFSSSWRLWMLCKPAGGICYSGPKAPPSTFSWFYAELMWVPFQRCLQGPTTYRSPRALPAEVSTCCALPTHLPKHSQAGELQVSSCPSWVPVKAAPTAKETILF